MVRAYERKVLSTTYRYTGDPLLAQDLAQEIFTKVWLRASSFRHKALFSTWLYRIVVNHCLNFQSNKKNKRMEPLDDTIAGKDGGMEQRYDAERKAGLLRQAMSRLPERQRMALILAKFEGKSYEEIAQVMRISVSSVESLLFRAREGLRKILLPLRERGEI